MIIKRSGENKLGEREKKNSDSVKVRLIKQMFYTMILQVQFPADCDL